MKLSNSSLVVHTRISSFKSSPRNREITKITPHHVAGNASIESIGQVFQTPGRNASSNYGIGSDGRVGMYVEERDRSWCSSSAANDNQALTIEVANNSGSPNWNVSNAAWESLINLCVDMCRRNPGIKQKNGKTGIYCDDTPNASLTFHRYFSATGCAQPFIWGRRQQLCSEVNRRLESKPNLSVQSQAFPIAEKNIKAMVDLGIINSPDYWRNVNTIQWLNELMANVAQSGVSNKQTNNGIADIKVALKTLVDAGIINSPDYWQNLIDRNAERFLAALIINMANRTRC